jgi:hypothetical protein
MPDTSFTDRLDAALSERHDSGGRPPSPAFPQIDLRGLAPLRARRLQELVPEADVTVAVRVRATVTGHRRRGVQEHDLALALPPGAVSARQIIEAAVAAEVAAHEARAGEASLVRVLTAKSLLDDLGRGAVRMGDVVSAGPVDIAAAAGAALLAFDDGIFKVFVGDREVDPAAPVDLTDGASVLFLRLVPLAGG